MVFGPLAFLATWISPVTPTFASGIGGGSDAKRCWLDLWAFESKLDRHASEASKETSDQRIGEAIALYRGDFLPDDDDVWWTSERRDALRRRYRSALYDGLISSASKRIGSLAYSA